jgi:hypothetical protein
LHRSEDAARYIGVKSTGVSIECAWHPTWPINMPPRCAESSIQLRCWLGPFLPGNSGAASGGGGVEHLLRELALGGYEVADDLALGCE